MEATKQAESRKQSDQIITEQDWIELTRKLMKRATPFFSSEELATIHGFINFTSGDVERIQIEARRSEFRVIETPPLNGGGANAVPH